MNLDIITITTVDLHEPYEIIGPIFTHVSNEGLFSSQLAKLKKEYQEEIAAMRARLGESGEEPTGWAAITSELGSGNDFDSAFYIVVQELKKRALLMGADAIVGMRQDLDFNPQSGGTFYLKMYGTAVRRKRP
jgi:hypothetical protein